MLSPYPAVQGPLQHQTPEETAANRPGDGQVDQHHHHGPLSVPVRRQLADQIVERSVDSGGSEPSGHQDDLNCLTLEAGRVEEWRNVLLGFIFVLYLLLLSFQMQNGPSLRMIKSCGSVEET